MGDVEQLNEEDLECPICLDKLGDKGRAIFTSECGHDFHFSCLQSSIDHDDSKTCPYCRKPMTEWPEPTPEKKHFCPNCGKQSKKSFCTSCGAACGEQLIEAGKAAVKNGTPNQPPPRPITVLCPTCRVQIQFPGGSSGVQQCPTGHRFRLPEPRGAAAAGGQRGAAPRNPTSAQQAQQQQQQMHMRMQQMQIQQQQQQPQRIIRACPVCRVHIQIPPNSGPGVYACPSGHRFRYVP